MKEDVVVSRGYDRCMIVLPTSELELKKCPNPSCREENWLPVDRKDKEGEKCEVCEQFLESEINVTWDKAAPEAAPSESKWIEIALEYLEGQDDTSN